MTSWGSYVAALIHHIVRAKFGWLALTIPLHRLFICNELLLLQPYLFQWVIYVPSHSSARNCD